MHVRMTLKLIYLRKRKRKIKYMSTIYGDIHKLVSNLDCRTNLVMVLVLGCVMLDPLQLQSLLDLLSSPFGRLTLIESQKM